MYSPFFSELFLKAEKMTMRVSQRLVISQSIVTYLFILTTSEISVSGHDH